MPVYCHVNVPAFFRHCNVAATIVLAALAACAETAAAPSRNRETLQKYPGKRTGRT